MWVGGPPSIFLDYKSRLVSPAEEVSKLPNCRPRRPLTRPAKGGARPIAALKLANTTDFRVQPPAPREGRGVGTLAATENFQVVGDRCLGDAKQICDFSLAESVLCVELMFKIATLSNG